MIEVLTTASSHLSALSSWLQIYSLPLLLWRLSLYAYILYCWIPRRFSSNPLLAREATRAQRTISYGFLALVVFFELVYLIKT